MTNVPLSPERIMQIATGSWAAAILSTGVAHSVFNHLESEGLTAANLAQKAKLSPRGAQAILDGLAGLGLLKLVGGKYSNTPESSAFLVEGKPAYFGGFCTFNFQDSPRWLELPEAVQTGAPKATDTTDVKENPFWEKLVLSIAALSAPVAQIAAERLGIAKAGPVEWLDVGGGSGVYSAVWLAANPRAKATQLDWANVNPLARGFVSKFGVGDRFTTVDGDFHEIDFGTGRYDFGIYSHIAHQEAPQDNIAIFRKFRRALKPGGTLLISDFVLGDDRTGHSFAMMFTSMMVRQTKAGAAWRRSDYSAWLGESGFKSVTFEPTPTPATLIFAQ